MRLITCPERIESPRPIPDFACFLAGGITNCPDWQQDAIKALEDTDVILLNPRRDNFDITDPVFEKEQIAWEYDHINLADVMLFWFPEETLCPITLFELGKCSAWGRLMVVGTHPGYKRRIDVIEQLSHIAPRVPVRDSLEATIADLKDTIHVLRNRWPR